MHRTSYLSAIDGLRAIAVVSVILFHLDAALLPGGFTGVDIFFVISGYVVSKSLVGETGQDFWRFTAGFYARRLLRIYPALIVCLLVSALIQALVVPQSWLSDSTRQTALYAFAGVSNFALIWTNDGYFSPRVEFNPFTHTWSLAVEEQFYLFYPAIFFVWMNWRSRHPSLRFIATWSLPALALASLAYAAYTSSASPQEAFYLLPSRFWELASGAYLFKLHHRGRFIVRRRLTSDVLGLVGLVCFAAAFVWVDSRAFPFPWALLPVAGSLLTLSAVASNPALGSAANRLLEAPGMVYVGKLSYSLYLWHWPVFVLFRWTLGLEAPGWEGLALGLTVACAVFSFHQIENPVRRNAWISARPNFVVVLAGVGVIGFSALFASIMIFKQQPDLTLSVTRERRDWYPEPLDIPDSAAKAGQLVGRTLFVMGDSHTWAYGRMFQALRNDTGIHVRRFSSPGCPVLNFLTLPQGHCLAFIQDTVQQIVREAKPGDMVFLASLRMPRLGDQWKTFDIPAVLTGTDSVLAQAEREKAFLHAEQVTDALLQAPVRIIIDRPKPIFPSPSFRCSDWFNRSNPVCAAGLNVDQKTLDRLRGPVIASMDRLAAERAGIAIWDPFPVLCPSPVCQAHRDKRPLFFDGDHLSGYGNEVLYPSFLRFILGMAPLTRQ